MKQTIRHTKYVTSVFDPETREFWIYKKSKLVDSVVQSSIQLTLAEAFSFARLVLSIGQKYLISGLIWRKKREDNKKE
jgi:hypothetical protein